MSTVILSSAFTFFFMPLLMPMSFSLLERCVWLVILHGSECRTISHEMVKKLNVSETQFLERIIMNILKREENMLQYWHKLLESYDIYYNHNEKTNNTDGESHRKKWSRKSSLILENITHLGQREGEVTNFISTGLQIRHACLSYIRPFQPCIFHTVNMHGDFM